jgi:glutamate-ammonia-ligase adenylyltransferase
MLRIAWRDIAGRAAVTETLRAVSDLADGCIRAAIAAAAAAFAGVFGKPRNAAGDEVPLIVLGMGKLGGRELNFSSDIDLVFLFSEGGETDGRA